MGRAATPGVAGYGALVRDADSGRVLVELAEPLGKQSNNVAEYSGLLAGPARRRRPRPVGRRRRPDGLQARRRADVGSLEDQARGHAPPRARGPRPLRRDRRRRWVRLLRVDPAREEQGRRRPEQRRDGRQVHPPGAARRGRTTLRHRTDRRPWIRRHVREAPAGSAAAQPLRLLLVQVPLVEAAVPRVVAAVRRLVGAGAEVVTSDEPLALEVARAVGADVGAEPTVSDVWAGRAPGEDADETVRTAYRSLAAARGHRRRRDEPPRRALGAHRRARDPGASLLGARDGTRQPHRRRGLGGRLGRGGFHQSDRPSRLTDAVRYSAA